MNRILWLGLLAVTVVVALSPENAVVAAAGPVIIAEGGGGGPVVEGGGGPSDVTPPGAIADLAVAAVGEDSTTLSWTNTGDDGSVGTAKTLDIRYSTAGPIDGTNFAAATPITGEPAPTASGTMQSMTVTGLSMGMTYHWAVQVSDEVGNKGPVSNSTSGTTQPVPPDAVQDLAATDATQTTVTLRWTAPGDDGNTGQCVQYDVRYSQAAAIMTDADFAAATQVLNEPAPGWAGTSEFMVVSGLTDSTAYWFCVKAMDDMGNTGPVSNVASATTGTPGGSDEDNPRSCGGSCPGGAPQVLALALGLLAAGLAMRRIC